MDDPVSSLDANALFLAFGFIRERTEAVGQLFVLTHNFSFFRQIRNWFHHLKGQNKQDVSQRPARFFMLDYTLMDDARSSAIRVLDPLLEQYESEYQYLFARVHRASIRLASAGLEDYYVLPNIARRMLEAFLAFRLPQISGNLWKQLKAIRFDESKKLRIYRFLNTHSHSIAVGEPEHDLTALGEGAGCSQRPVGDDRVARRGALFSNGATCCAFGGFRRRGSGGGRGVMSGGRVAESDVEGASLEWLSGLGYKVIHGPDIAPEGPTPERLSYDQVPLTGLPPRRA